MSTGMISSLYESTVWEEITGEESVSTISILSKASEENIDILLLSKANLSAEIEKLHTDGTTKQSIINAVNSSMVVTVPAEDITMGDWSGTGYIVTNPETGTGAYMISGGLNGGSVPVSVDSMFLVGQMYLSTILCNQVQGMVSMAELFSTGFLFGSTVGTLFACAGLIYAVYNVISTCNKMTLLYQRYYDYILDDSEENEKAMIEAINQCYNYNIWNAIGDGISGVGTWYALYG